VSLSGNLRPQVNGCSSDDAKSGWGAANGRVYQKAFVEFFCSPDMFKDFVRKVQALSSQSYMAANARGDFFSDADSTAAVSWGAFPGCEIKQPLVVCANGFRAWAEEAFELWSTMWGAVAEESSEASKLLSEIKENWFLVSLLESDYVCGDVFRIFAA
jgi:methylenetetrahydrofolate reductase (NADPH)